MDTQIKFYVHGSTATSGNQDFATIRDKHTLEKRKLCPYAWPQLLKIGKTKNGRIRNMSIPGCSIQQVFRDVLNFLVNSPEYQHEERLSWYFLIELPDPHIIELHEEMYGITIFVQPDNSILLCKDGEIVSIKDLSSDMKKIINDKTKNIELLRETVYTPSVVYQEFLKNVILLEHTLRYRSGYLDNFCFLSASKTATLTGDPLLRGLNDANKIVGRETCHIKTFEQLIKTRYHIVDILDYVTKTDLGLSYTAEAQQLFADEIEKNIILRRNWVNLISERAEAPVE